MDIDMEQDEKYDMNDETDYFDKVDEDFARYGKTKLPCPSCGGKLIYGDYGSGHIIRCKEENCIKVTYRGI
ncbi:hypothetical protein JHL18_15030 [Clostridium sp. YIM B02505]|uniref:Uncharacterized protein n=1 Tax=Clostridium yunnanense TaxID=2800325 RepID=A0ABS1ERM8_9CLOT|nr:hypothetical protein [Clostridium yunnanense]MBK1811933.1 hypothetical protein [Clostridium yunnanense]